MPTPVPSKPSCSRTQVAPTVAPVRSSVPWTRRSRLTPGHAGQARERRERGVGDVGDLAADRREAAPERAAQRREWRRRRPSAGRRVAGGRSRASCRAAHGRAARSSRSSFARGRPAGRAEQPPPQARARPEGRRGRAVVEPFRRVPGSCARSGRPDCKPAAARPTAGNEYCKLVDRMRLDGSSRQCRHDRMRRAARTHVCCSETRSAKLAAKSFRHEALTPCSKLHEFRPQLFCFETPAALLRGRIRRFFDRACRG